MTANAGSGDAYRILEQMFETVARTTRKPARDCFNQLVRYLADCTRICPLPESEHHIGERLWPLTMRFMEAFYEDPQDHLGTLFTEKECTNDRLGQVITPRPVVQFIIQATIGELAEGEEDEWQLVLDPCTGTGRFLVEAAVQFPRRKLAFYGVELDLDLYRAALVNLRLVAWHRPYFLLQANSLIVDVSANSPNWEHANRWDPPDWQTELAMESGEPWAEWREQEGDATTEARALQRELGSDDLEDPLQPRLLG